MEDNRPETEVPPPPEVAEPTSAPASLTVAMPKSPRVAAFLSAFPGLGNIYNGLYLRGTTFFVLFLAMVQLAQHREELWLPAAMFVWFFNILDSYRQAKLINHGVATDLGLADQPEPAAGSQGSLLAGIAIFLVGLLAFLDVQLGLDMDRVLDFWPVGLMGLGGWFVWSGIRARDEVGSSMDDELVGGEDPGTGPAL